MRGITFIDFKVHYIIHKNTIIQIKFAKNDPPQF